MLPPQKYAFFAGFLVCNVCIGTWNAPGLLPGFTPGGYWFPKFQHLRPGIILLKNFNFA